MNDEDELHQLRIELSECTAQLVAAQAQWTKTNGQYEQAAKAVTRLEHERMENRHHLTRLEGVIAGQRRILAGRHHGWVETKLHLVKEIERWRATATGEVPTIGHGAKHAHIAALEQELSTLRAAHEAKGKALRREQDYLRVREEELLTEVQSEKLAGNTWKEARALSALVEVQLAQQALDATGGKEEE